MKNRSLAAVIFCAAGWCGALAALPAQADVLNSAQFLGSLGAGVPADDTLNTMVGGAAASGFNTDEMDSASDSESAGLASKKSAKPAKSAAGQTRAGAR